MKIICLQFLFIFSSFITLKGQDNLIGTYAVYLNGTATGASVAIQKTSVQYVLTIRNQGQADNQMAMIASGEGLAGKDENGTVFAIVATGNTVIFQYGLLYTFVLMKTSEPTQTVGANYAANNSSNTSNNSGQTDQRLVGKWIGSNPRAGTSSQYVYAFASNGEYASRYSFSGGGNGWSGGANSDPVEKGNYKIVTINRDGGVLSINGQQVDYVFYSNNQKMKLGNMRFEKR